MVILSLLLAGVLALPQAISLDLRDADLRDVLMTLGATANLNVLLHPAVAGKVTLNVHDVPWEVLLDMVLRNYNLGREVQGSIMRIAPLSVLESEYKQRAATEAARLSALPLETRTYVLSYARAADVAVAISKFLSPRGVVIVDPRRNMLIIRDVVP
jgi:type II secretory pathway component HofQ